MKGEGTERTVGKEEAADRMEELAELGVLAASLLHELRQPLFAMKGRLQIARKQGRALNADDIKLLLDHLGHMEELVEHHAGLGRPDDTWQPIDLAHEVARAVAMLGPRIRLAQATVALPAQSRTHVVRGRPVAVRQVVLNLVGNALDAVAQQEGPREVSVALTQTDGAHEILVSDNGPGIPVPDRDVVFEPFVTTKPNGRGTGLGLYIARRLLEEMGGTIVFAKAPGPGTHVRVRLPALLG